MGRSPAIIVILSLGTMLGCYKPNIEPGGFACGPHGECPENFRCASNLRCYQGDAGMDSSTTPVCTSVTPDAATCSRAAADGQPCTPACEFGCGCGWCAVVNGNATCLKGTPGTKKVGDVCDPANSSDCAPGLMCHAECGTGRCYKYCDPASNDADCQSIGTHCSGPAVDGAGSLRLCTLPDPACDPVSGGKCPSGFACYPFVNSTECDCAGTGKVGDTCNSVVNCAPGYTCIIISNVKTCQKTCAMSSDCSPGLCSNPALTAYGYCVP